MQSERDSVEEIEIGRKEPNVSDSHCTTGNFGNGP